MRHLAHVELGAATHTGRVRSSNEDDYLVLAPQSRQELAERGWFLAIADGMGGVTGGAEASRTAIRAVVRPFLDPGPAEPATRLRAGFAAATQAVYGLSRENPNLRDMGTTLTVLHLAGEQAWVGHVGDTRCLRLRAGRLDQLTEDHAVRDPDNLLTRCIGAGQTEVEIDLFSVDVAADDRFILATDGLWGVVGDADIRRLVTALPPQSAAEELVRLANRNGGPDNSTIVILRVLSRAGGEATTEVDLPAEEVRHPAIFRQPDTSLMPSRWPWLLLVAGLVVLVLVAARIFYGLDPLALLPG